MTTVYVIVAEYSGVIDEVIVFAEKANAEEWHEELLAEDFYDEDTDTIGLFEAEVKESQ